MKTIPSSYALDIGDILSLSILVIMLSVSVFTELKDHTIPNWITLPGMAFGLLIGYFSIGQTLGSSLLGLSIGFGVLFVFYLMGGMGGGDVKLMGAVGALQGYPQILPTLFYTSLIGAMMAIGVLIWKRKCRERLKRDLLMVFSKKEGSKHTEEEFIPYGLAIALGSLIDVFQGGFGL